MRCGARHVQSCVAMPSIGEYGAEKLGMGCDAAHMLRLSGALPCAALVWRGSRLAHLPDAAVHSQDNGQILATLYLLHRQIPQSSAHPALRHNLSSCWLLLNRCLSILIFYRSIIIGLAFPATST